jgi:hypothetical protein
MFFNKIKKKIKKAYNPKKKELDKNLLKIIFFFN